MRVIKLREQFQISRLSQNDSSDQKLKNRLFRIEFPQQPVLDYHKLYTRCHLLRFSPHIPHARKMRLKLNLCEQVLSNYFLTSFSSAISS